MADQTDAETRWPPLDLSVNLISVTDETLDQMTWKGSGWPAWAVRCIARELQVARERLAHNDGGGRMICGYVTRLIVSWIGEFTILCDKPKGHRGQHVRPAHIDGGGA
jgi:hypothetical protein